MLVVVREIPLPVASFVKKPVPWTLISFLISWDDAEVEKSSTGAKTANNHPFMLVLFSHENRFVMLRPEAAALSDGHREQKPLLIS